MKNCLIFLCAVLGFCHADGNAFQSRKLQQSEEGSVAPTQYGPESFFDKDFYLTVKGGIVVNVYEGDQKKPTTKIVLDQQSKSVRGSYINKTDFSVSIDWKTSTFRAKNADLSLDGIIIKMFFKKKSKEFALTSITADQMVIGNSNLRDLEVRAVSKMGYVVSAPLGLAFDCADAGVFPPARSQNGAGKYRIGLSFPKMKLQVFDLNEPKYGPSWTCGNVMTIGVWIGLLVTLFFALICYWGFSMLANIQTMDRFDDPKGKPIHVPQSE